MNFLTTTNKSKATEVLFFEDAEIEKYKGTYEAFGSIGSLSVLYFKDYNRFVLQINDWKYPLLRRLPIVLTSDKTNVSSRTYVFPTSNGFTFQLKINNIPSHQALINFETILGHSSLFSVKGEDISNRKLESSPDDKLVRHQTKDTASYTDIITDKIKSAVHMVTVKTATMKTGTKNLTSTKKALVLKDIKNKNFKKTAKSSFKKDFFRAGDISTYEMMAKRRNNKNLVEAKEFSALAKSSDVPTVFINKEDIEESIIRNKELASSGQFTPIEKEQKKGMFQNISQGISNLAQKAGLKKDELIGGARATATNIKEEKLTQLESTHHSEA